MKIGALKLRLITSFSFYRHKKGIEDILLFRSFLLKSEIKVKGFLKITITITITITTNVTARNCESMSEIQFNSQLLFVINNN